MKKKLLTRSINTIVIASALSLLTGCSGSGGTDSIVDDIEAELENISNGDSSDTDTSDADSSESDETENSDSSTMDDETATAFPSDLAVASPTDVESNSTTASITSSGVKSLALKNSNPSVTTLSAPTSPATAYEQAVDRINALLTGSTALSDTFTPELFYSYGGDADCYGPKLQYANHPDGTGTESGELPPGDLGIWAETEGETAEACVAAQLNARMEGIKDGSYISLMTVASMIRVYADAGNSFPTDIEAQLSSAAVPVVEDVTTLMQALGLTDVTINSATITLSADGSQWTYAVDFTYTRAGDDLDIEVELVHIPGADKTQYEGLLTYRADDTFNGGNCSSSDSSNNGSLHYIRTSADQMLVQSRVGQFCDHGTSGLTAAVESDTLAGFVVDPSASWGNNFSIFTAEFNPADLIGNYSYAWQAGRMDSNSRILNMSLTDSSTGTGYFGYGDTIDATDGSVQGFICNWAGPGNDHTLVDYVQSQSIQYDTTTEIFAPNVSLINYAPVNSCIYDGSATFAYDRNLDEDLADETADTINVGAGETLEFNLMGLNTEASIWEEIQAAGFTLPAYPQI